MAFLLPGELAFEFVRSFETLGRNAAARDRRKHGTTGLAAMAAIAESTRASERVDFGKASAAELSFCVCEERKLTHPRVAWTQQGVSRV